ncbi:MAG: GIY-YIG nuclease family protein [Thermodesulfobacteriota bacterium]
MTAASLWFVYILRCSDNTLYTGITTDLARRLAEHNSEDRGARYTRGRRPVTLAYSEEAPSRSAAAKREWSIKRLAAPEKLALIKTAGAARPCSPSP